MISIWRRYPHKRRDFDTTGNIAVSNGTTEVIVPGDCLCQCGVYGTIHDSSWSQHVHSFGATDPVNLSWFAAAYSLTAGTFILVAGRLGDVFGHRNMFVIGFCWFSVWSNQIFFDCCRALQGIGPAMLLPNAIAILGRTYRLGLRKEMIFSLFGATAPGGFIVGVFSHLSLPSSSGGPGNTGPQPKFDDKFRLWQRLDRLGATAGISGVVLIKFAWNQAALVGWKNPYTYALLIVVFTGELAWVLGCIAAGWSSFGIIIYYFYQFMDVIKGDSPLLATAKWSGAAASDAVAALITEFLLGRLPPSVIMFCAMAFFTACLSIFATVPVNQPTGCWHLWDMSFPSGTLILSNSMPRHHQGLAASLVATTVNYSIPLGLGFVGTVETQVNDAGNNVLRGYRGALYMGIGLAALGLALSICFMLTSWRQYHHSQKSQG
ncbi:hypothetical protein N7463_006655 [Penicillium fimorum]|uniref:MFS general substrate transporter n=1 Tax=Penicillium fimorum TaxID=1882269 RepID=A0A9X0C6U2_9EURO|nr:hypothetical protein N7463_006655 [Penicillium fimorum]